MKTKKNLLTCPILGGLSAKMYLLTLLLCFCNFVYAGTKPVNKIDQNKKTNGNVNDGDKKRSRNTLVKAALVAAPNISYAGPQVYMKAVPIAPLTPSNTGGIVPAPAVTTLFTSASRITALTRDNSGNFYGFKYNQQSSKNGILVKILPDGSVVTLDSTSFNTISSVAADNKGHLFIGDSGLNTIFQIPITGGTAVALKTGLTKLGRLALDTAGNIYYADVYNGAIKKIPAGNGATVTLASGLGLWDNSVGVDIHRNVYFISAYDVMRLPAAGGSPVSLFHSDLGRIANLITDAVGNVYCFAFYPPNYANLKIPANGSGAIVTLEKSGFKMPVAVDQSANIYSSDEDTVVVTRAGNYSISPSLPAGLFFNSRNGTIYGTPSTDFPSTNYTITAKNAAGSSSTTLNITSLKSNDANLSNLEVTGGGVLTPVLDPATTNYSATVYYNTPSVKVYAYPSLAGPTITINGEPLPPGNLSHPIAINAGPNTFTLVVTAQDGTTKTYTLIVTQAPNPTADLNSLFLSKGVLTPAFNADTLNYTSAVSNTVSSVTVKFYGRIVQGSIVKVNGITVANATASPPVPLAVGNNVITVFVTAADGVTRKTYTVTVNRAPSANAYLSSLIISRGVLSPKYSRFTYSYTTSVGNGITSVTMKPTTVDVNTTVKVNGATVASGTTSSDIPLAVGNNTITTVATAQDGSSTATYTIIVTRAGGALNSIYQLATFAGTTGLQRAADGILIHNGLSPNGDGINDFLLIEGITAYPDNKLQIINRTGQLVFEAKNYDNSTKVFDGHSNKTGAMQLPGTYFYALDYMTNGVKKHKTGFIVLKY